MTAKEHIEELQKEFLDKFSHEYKHLKVLTSDFHAEEGRKLGYKGREILELLQNVDDEYERLCQEHPEKRGHEVNCLIEFKDNVLRVCNTGTVFNEDGIDSICQAATSNKGEKYIGQKGIGFRSILNWAKEVHIYSGDYSVGFSEEIAAEKLQEIASKSENVRKQLEREQKNKKSELKIPMLNVPQCIERKIFNYSENYDTIIEIVVKPETQNDDWSIENQIEKFDENILLFLPNLTKINFIVDDKKYTFTKKVDEMDSKRIKLLIESPERNEEIEYCVYTPQNDIYIEDRLVRMAIAIPRDKNVECDRPMYTFFPIGKQDSQFNALFHATFDLDDNRETISKLDINKEIFKELLKLYTEVVTENFCKTEFENRCLELLCPKNFLRQFWAGWFDSPFDSSEIKEYYLNLCREKAKFFTVNEEFILNNKKPKVIEDAPEFFKGNLFKDLLIPIDKSLSAFFEKITSGDIYLNPEELCERINKLSETLTIQQRVETFVWWCSNKSTSESDLLPRLLEDNSNEQNWLEFGDSCFLSGEVSDIPNWADFRFLDDRYEKELKEQSSRFSFDLSKYKRFVNFENFTIESIISPLNEKVNDDFDKSVDFVRFLYTNFDIIKDIESLKEISFNFPNSDGEVSNSKSLFFGKEYGNDFSEKILELTGYKKVFPIGLLGFKDAEKSNVEEFLSNFGVVKFPKIYENIEVFSSLKWDEKHGKKIYEMNGDSDYYRYVKNKLSNLYEINGIKTRSINNIKIIIQSLSTEELLLWIFKDEGLKLELLKNNIDAQMMYRLRYEKTTDAEIYRAGRVVPCYINYVFSTEKWLVVNGEKYSPSECLFSTDSRISKYYKRCISNDWINQNCGSFPPKEFKELLLKLGMKSKITELDSENFYSLLLELQKDDNSFEISKQIYASIINDGVKEFGYSNTQYKFRNEGKVWTKNKKGYQLVSNVFFSSSAVVNAHNKYLIDLPLRTGSKEVMKNVFFVEHYEESYTIEQTSIHESLLDTEFQNCFYEYLPYVFCYRMSTADSSEQNKFKNLKIKIVDAIKIKDDEGVENVSVPYTLLRDSEDQNKWYIFTKDEKPNWNELSELLKQVFEVLINTSNMNKLDRFCELFIADKSRRDFLIEKDLGRISVLQESKKFLHGNESEKELIVKYLKQHNKFSGEVSNMLTELDFSSLSDCTQQRKLYNFLHLINLDIEDLQKIIERNDISIEQYNLKRIKTHFAKKSKEFRQLLYEELKNKDLDEKKLYLQKLEEFKNYPKLNNFEDGNSIYFDIDNIYNEALVYFLGEKKEFSSETLIDVDGLYSKNVGNLKERYGELDAIPQDIESLLFFDYADIETEFSTWKKNSVKEAVENGKNKFEATRVCFDEVKPVKRTSNQSAKAKVGKVSVSRVRSESDKEKQEQGDAAEKDIYDAIDHPCSDCHKSLEEKLGITLSDYTVGQISKGLGRKLNQHGEDGLGYDIELINKRSEGENFYIEVKSSKGSECQFNMSRNELDFAKSHPDNYRLIFVGDMEKKNHSVQVLEKQFWNMQKYVIDPKDYTVRAYS